MFGAKRTIMAMVMTPEDKDLFGIMGNNQDQLIIIVDPEEALTMLCESEVLDFRCCGEKQHDRALQVEAIEAGFELRFSFFVPEGNFKWQ